MKNNKILRISLLMLSLALVFAAAFAMNINATETQQDPKLEIISQNIEYGNQFKLMYAVDASTVTEAPVTLEIYETEPTEGVGASYTYTVSTPETVAKLNKSCYVFTTNGISYTAMAQNFYIKAVDNAGVESAVKRYSVAEYLYERLADTTATEEQVNFYNEAIDFGASAEILFGGKTTDSADLMTKLAYVVVKGGTIDGYTTGVYPVGQTLNLKADDTTAVAAKWSLTTYNAGVVATELVNQASIVVEDADVNAIECGEKIVINYRDQVITYNDKSPSDSFSGWPENATAEYVTEAGHGTAVKAQITANGGAIIFSQGTINTSIATLENATAIEFSFDFKMDLSAVDSSKFNTSKGVYLVPFMGLGSTPVHRTGLFGNISGYDSVQQTTITSDNLIIANPSKTVYSGPDYYTILDEIDPTEWFHVRMVYYKGDPNCYVYINGSEEPTYINTVINASTYTGEDLSLITQARIKTEAYAINSYIYFDNLFFGYTLDKLPEATN